MAVKSIPTTSLEEGMTLALPMNQTVQVASVKIGTKYVNLVTKHDGEEVKSRVMKDDEILIEVSDSDEAEVTDEKSDSVPVPEPAKAKRPGKVDFYAVCLEHMQDALEAILTRPKSDGMFKVTRWDGQSKSHKCHCHKPADYHFARVETMNHRTLARYGIRLVG